MEVSSKDIIYNNVLQLFALMKNTDRSHFRSQLIRALLHDLNPREAAEIAGVSTQSINNARKLDLYSLEIVEQRYKHGIKRPRGRAKLSESYQEWLEKGKF